MAKIPKLQKSIFPQSSKISTWQLDWIKVDSLEMFCTPYQLPSPNFAKPPRPFVVYVENSRFLPNFLEKSTILRIWSTPVDQNFYVTKNTKISSFWPYFWNFHISRTLEDILLWISNARGPGFQITSFIYIYIWGRIYSWVPKMVGHASFWTFFLYMDEIFKF